MSRSLGYIRKFIIFKKDYSNIQKFNPRGHGKIEIKGLKGNMSISIESAEPDTSYHVAFVDKRNAEIIGKIYTEENGKGKADIVYNLSDLAAKGFSPDDINGILIFRDSSILLGGYMIKEDGSIEEFIERLPKEVVSTEVEEEVEEYTETEWVAEEEYMIPATEPVSEEVLAPMGEEDIPEEYMVLASEPVSEEELAPMGEEDIPEEYMVLASEPVSEEVLAPMGEEDIPEEYMVPASEPVSGEEFVPMGEEDIPKEYMVPASEPVSGEEFVPMGEEDIPKEYMVPAVESIPEDDTFKEESITHISSSSTYSYDNIEITRKVTQKNQTTNYILNILRYFSYTDPFKFDLNGYNWWEINFDEEADDEGRGFLPYFSLLIGGDQKYRKSNEGITPKELMQRYGHYIFGLYNENDEVKFYVYGVPGTFSKDEHPHKGVTGFNTWFEGRDVDGYWLLYIDPLHGKVIHPANPMSPTD